MKVERISMRGSMNDKSSSTVVQRLISDVRADGNLVSTNTSVSDTSNHNTSIIHMYMHSHLTMYVV